MIELQSKGHKTEITIIGYQIANAVLKMYVFCLYFDLKLYDCDGIVKCDTLNTASNALSFLKILHIG